jgi:hypothetical protein
MGHLPYWREGPFYSGELALPDAESDIWWSRATELLESQGALLPVPRPPGSLSPLFRRGV